MNLQARHLITMLFLVFPAVGMAMGAGCAVRQDSATLMPRSPSCEVHAEATRPRVLAPRSIQTQRPDSEVEWNAPFELRPPAPTTKAILLVHGLGDSPWSFVDVAPILVEQGYVVRTLLLRGHGTHPADLIGVRLEDWQRQVREQIIMLQRDFPDVWLGGFSTGANLVLEHALDDTRIRGLLLFSPALRSNELFDWATPWLVRLRPWLLSPETHPLQSPLRYHIVPTNGLAQFYRSSVAVRKRLKAQTFDRPAVIILAQHDSVVDVRYVRRIFERRFTHADSRLVWYGNPLPGSTSSSRVLVRPDALPQERISQFSHMSILFSPQNPLYGRDGSERICFNGQTDEDMTACQAGETVWYSDFDYREQGKIHARLTYNPYFDWQSQVIQDVLADAAALPWVMRASQDLPPSENQWLQPVP